MKKRSQGIGEMKKQSMEERLGQAEVSTWCLQRSMEERLKRAEMSTWYLRITIAVILAAAFTLFIVIKLEERRLENIIRDDDQKNEMLRRKLHSR